jgi:arginase
MNIDLYGVPLDLGSERKGVDMGPDALRYQNYVQNLRKAGLKITDFGNLPCPSPENVHPGNTNIKYLEPITQVCKKLAKLTIKSIKNKNSIIVLGGDHSIAIGSVSGASSVLQGKLGLIWIDAHGDLNTDKTTPSGNIHGMPCAAILGEGHKDLTHLIKNKPAINYENLILIGLKDLDPPEREFIRNHNLKSFFIKDILSEGLKPIFSAIEELNKRLDKIWVSLDLDGIDSSEAPGVGMPNKGGLTYREIFAMSEFIGLNCNVLGLDVVEYNPVNDIEHKTAILATELTSKIFGKEFSNYSQYLNQQSLVNKSIPRKQVDNKS